MVRLSIETASGCTALHDVRVRLPGFRSAGQLPHLAAVTTTLITTDIDLPDPVELSAQEDVLVTANALRTTWQFDSGLGAPCPVCALEDFAIVGAWNEDEDEDEYFDDDEDDDFLMDEDEDEEDEDEEFEDDDFEGDDEE